MTTVEATGPLRPRGVDADSRALVLSGWSTVTGYGVGRDALRDGLLSGRSAVADLEAAGFPGPARAAVVPGFKAADHLGRKGTRTMSRSTAFAVTAVDVLLRELGPEVTEDPERIGLVLGVGQGNVQAAMDFTREALTASRPYHVDAMRFPDTFLNRAAGQSAIWHHLKGPNTTIAGGRLSALLAIGYGARLCRGGHCRRLLVGATEEYSQARALLVDAASGPSDAPAPLGEGCLVALMESAADAAAAGRVPVATVLATHFRATPEPETGGAELAECVRAVLAKAGATADRIRLVAPLGEHSEQEEAGIRAVTGRSAMHWLHCRPLLGDAFAASAGLQLSAALAAGRHWSEPADLALVTGIDRDGTVGCALLGRPA
ncbi:MULTISPECIES: beta-ketoacyl synthase N-terminal-like domain-containing protein [unclassified Streptomyces]|uniref:beta-ketoacyl synthase N-terminal-like domain-containing protein n=1 Tax=unclassified Streptomyces TaxID=2593676 RepID=UPI0033D314E5